MHGKLHGCSTLNTTLSSSPAAEYVAMGVNDAIWKTQCANADYPVKLILTISMSMSSGARSEVLVLDSILGQ